MGKYSEKKLCTKNIIIKRNSLQFSSGKPFWTVAPTRPGRYSGLDPFKLSEPAGDGDSTVVVEPELLLCPTYTARWLKYITGTSTRCNSPSFCPTYTARCPLGTVGSRSDPTTEPDPNWA